jgi:diguanylate cyclase (GGDEF)-like protein
MPKPFVLIVEDERDIAALFRHFMDLAGYRTEIAFDGALALERLSTCRPDAILLDLSLPHTSGAHILQAIRRDERLKSIPVIVITGHSELAKHFAVEPDLVLLKPVASEQVIALLERLRRKNRTMETAALHEAPYDQLTGLYNRSFFLYRVDSAIRSMQDNGQNLFAVLSLGSSLYETIRRQSGEPPANEFLREMAVSLKISVRPTDTVARLEGDRFCILIEQAPGLRIPDMIAARVQKRLRNQSINASGEPVSYNIAVLLCDARYTDASKILTDAQTSYTLAEAAGPGACLTFDYDTIRRDTATSGAVAVPSPATQQEHQTYWDSSYELRTEKMLP